MGRSGSFWNRHGFDISWAQPYSDWPVPWERELVLKAEAVSWDPVASADPRHFYLARFFPLLKIYSP